VQFAPDPNNRSFLTKPGFVNTRLARDVVGYSEGVNYISFHDVVVTEVQLSNDKTQTLISEPISDTGVHFATGVNQVQIACLHHRQQQFLFILMLKE
jgi:hypothetical protein